MTFRREAAIFHEALIVGRAASEKITLTITEASAVLIVTILCAACTGDSLGFRRAEKDEQADHHQQAEHSRS
jgi:hypothetical protein